MPDPPTFYGHSKLAAEHAAMSFSQLFCVQALRFFFVYGPGQEAGAFLPGVARRVREGRPIDLIGDDGMRCNPIYVDDAVTAVEQAMRAETHAIVNVAGSEIVSLREIGAKLARLQRREAHYLQRPGMSDLVADTTRMRHLLSAPRVSLSSGLQRLMESLPGERV